MRLIERTARWVDPKTFKLMPLWYPEYGRRAYFYKANWSEPQMNKNRQTGHTEHKREGNLYANKALTHALGLRHQLIGSAGNGACRSLAASLARQSAFGCSDTAGTGGGCGLNERYAPRARFLGECEPWFRAEEAIPNCRATARKLPRRAIATTASSSVWRAFIVRICSCDLRVLQDQASGVTSARTQRGAVAMRIIDQSYIALRRSRDAPADYNRPRAIAHLRYGTQRSPRAQPKIA
jgi:hypothetical protein